MPLAPTDLDDIVVGVKTWSGNHATRVQVVKRTWGKDASHILYFSDEADDSIPTVKTGAEYCLCVRVFVAYCACPQAGWYARLHLFLSPDDRGAQKHGCVGVCT